MLHYIWFEPHEALPSQYQSVFGLLDDGSIRVVFLDRDDIWHVGTGDPKEDEDLSPDRKVIGWCMPDSW